MVFITITDSLLFLMIVMLDARLSVGFRPEVGVHKLPDAWPLLQVGARPWAEPGPDEE